MNSNGCAKPKYAICTVCKQFKLAVDGFTKVKMSTTNHSFNTNDDDLKRMTDI